MGDDGRALHHISAIVDHFLSGEAVPAGARDVDRSGAPRDYRFAVAAPERGLLAAFTCAQLARASVPVAGSAGALHLRARLEEWHCQPWSAEPFLGGTDRGHLLSLFRPEPFPNGRHARRWVGGVEMAPPTLPGEPPPAGGGTVVSWLNLGCLSRGALASLEAVRAWDGGAALAAGGVDGLVWCLTEAEGARLHGAYRLGRLVAAIAPAQVKLLVFPSAWAGGEAFAPTAARSATGSAPPAGGQTAGSPACGSRVGGLARCAALAEAAVGERPLDVVPVEGGPAWLCDTGAGAGDDCSRLFQRLVASLELGAAALRRAAPGPGRAREAEG